MDQVDRGQGARPGPFAEREWFRCTLHTAALNLRHCAFDYHNTRVLCVRRAKE
jgi:hypothetical protein